MSEDLSQFTGEEQFLIELLYLLARDVAPLGEIQKYINEARGNVAAGAECIFTNNHLENWAKDEVSRVAIAAEQGTLRKERNAEYEKSYRKRTIHGRRN